jgi:hypothetical protein
MPARGTPCSNACSRRIAVSKPVNRVVGGVAAKKKKRPIAKFATGRFALYCVAESWANAL